MPNPPHITELVNRIAEGDPNKHLELMELCRACYAHVEEATRVARLEVLNALMDPQPPDGY